MITYFHLSTDEKLSTVESSQAANWLHLTNPTAAEIKDVAQLFKFSPFYLKKALDPNEIPHHVGLEQTNLDQPLMLLLQLPFEKRNAAGNLQYEVLPFSLVLSNECLITCSAHDLPLAPQFAQPSFQAAEISVPEKIILQLNWYFAERYNDFLSKIKTETETIEEQLRSATENEQLFQLIDLHKSLIYFETALRQNLAVINKAHGTPLLLNSPGSRSALANIQIEYEQALNSTQVLADFLAQLSNIFSAVVGNNLNSIMKTLTVITIILTIPTIIGGIYGMNVKLPFADDPFAYWWLLAATLLTSIGTVWFLKKKKYF